MFAFEVKLVFDFRVTRYTSMYKQTVLNYKHIDVHTLYV